MLDTPAIKVPQHARAKLPSWRDVLKVHPAANLFPMMAADELKALGEDIKQRGLTSPIAINASQYGGDWDYRLLDGRNRLDAMERAGIAFTLVLKDGQCIIEGNRFFPPAIVVETDLVAYVISANVHRRHLTAQQKLDLLDKAMKAHPSLSSRRIAKMVGVAPTTATKSRRKLEASGDVSTVDTSIDTKGRKQPTKKPPPKKKHRDVEDYLIEKKMRLAATLPTPPIEPAPPEMPTQPLVLELIKFSDDYCARIRNWRETHPDDQLTTLVHALKQVSSQLQMLVQELIF